MSQNKLEENLKQLLAESYVLMLKTQNYHWNVKGINFQSLHIMFENQYTDLFTAVDEIAERIQSIGACTPGTFQEFQKLSTIDSENVSKGSKEMLVSLIEDHKKLVKTAKKLVQTAQAVTDDATTDLVVTRTQVHEKHLWMMKSTLE